MLKRSGILVLLLLLIVTGFPCFVSGADTDVKYRALVIGNAEYCDESSSLLSVPGDIRRMSRVLAQSIIVPGVPQFSSIKQMNNITGKEILTAIESTFKDASNKDVSLFYFAGHGVLDAKGKAFLCGVDAVAGGVLGVDELEKALRQIPGTKIIILDCCYAGGFINILEEKRKAKDLLKADDSINQFNNAVLASFSKQSRSFPEHKHYKVLTSCAPKESAFGMYDDELKGYGGEFTNSFVKGAGIINGDYRADFDRNDIVSLDEMYIYTYKNVVYSSVQVYPCGDNLPC